MEITGSDVGQVKSNEFCDRVFRLRGSVGKVAPGTATRLAVPSADASVGETTLRAGGAVLITQPFFDSQ